MKKIIIKVLAVIVICALYGAYVRYSTIISAELVEDNGAEYIISFGGENHIYAR